MPVSTSSTKFMIVSIFSVKMDVVRPYSTPLAKAERFLQVLGCGDGKHRTENLFLENAHIRSRRCRKSSARQSNLCPDARASCRRESARALLLTDLDIVEIGLPLLFVHCRSHVDGIIQPGTDLDFFGPFHEPFEQGVFDCGSAMTRDVAVQR